MRLQLLLTCTLFLGGCTSSFTAFRGGHETAIDELRMEIADLKHALHGTEVEVKLLEERVESSEGNALPARAEETSDLKKKIAALERSVEKMSTEIRSLMNHASQTTSSLSAYREQILNIDRKLDEIAKLRSTLSQLSQSARSQDSSSSYRVKAGDSLEKIARKYQISVDAIKRENNLTSDKIVVGQELTIPSS